MAEDNTTVTTKAVVKSAEAAKATSAVKTKPVGVAKAKPKAKTKDKEANRELSEEEQAVLEFAEYEAKALEQIERLMVLGAISTEYKQDYLEMVDDFGIRPLTEPITQGYKRCGRCQHVKKFYLFNRNKGSKTNTTGNCKACQKGAAATSYKKTKQKRNYKEYYAENKEKKQEHAREYYQKNKDELNAKHKAYLGTAKGKKVMRRAHSKRAEAIASNRGIAYDRTWVLERDKRGGEHPVCYLCGNHILDITGAACHIDHVVSIGNGGLDCFTNVAAVHHTCNLTKEKDDRNLSAVQVETIVLLAEQYIDEHPTLFGMSEEE